MDRMLAIIFNNELKAYEGARALQELQHEGSINLYAKAVIARDASGKVEVKQQGDMGPIGTAVGLLVGGLVGMIGGPVGLAIGASVGTVGGMVHDLASIGVSQDFLDEVEESLEPGKAAVVAEVWEESTLPVDTSMEDLGGAVLRHTRREVLDDPIEKDIAALKFDLAELEAERDRASRERRARLQKQVDTTRGKLQAAQDDVQARIELSQKETDAKIRSLRDQAARDNGERKAKREARIDELKADQKRRSDLLKQAWELTKEALSA
jgi:uncharacterized membrane protein